MTKTLQELAEAGVAVWLDDLSRPRLRSGSLAAMVEQGDIVGITTNPTIFAKAIGTGPSQDWRSGGYRDWRVWIVSWVELLSEAGPERAIIDGAANLQQQVDAASRPAHLL